MINLPAIEKSFPFGEPTSTRLFIPVPFAIGDVMTDMVDLHGSTVIALFIPTMTCTHFRFRGSVDGVNEYLITRGSVICDATLIVPAQPVYEVLNDDTRAMAEGVRWARILFCDANGAGVASAVAGTIVLVVKYTS